VQLLGRIDLWSIGICYISRRVYNKYRGFAKLEKNRSPFIPTFPLHRERGEQEMKKIGIAALIIGLFVSLTPPVSASTGLTLFTWVHTSDGIGEGSPPSFPDIYALAFSPNYATDHTMYAGTYIGIYRSTDKGLTWTHKMTITPPAINSLSVSPVDPTGNTIIAGTEDNILQTTTRWDSYSGIGPAGLGVSYAVYSPDYVHDRMIFAGTGGYGIRAKAGAGSWFSIDEGTILGKVTGIVFDPNYAANHILYAGSYGHGVYQGNGGATGSSWNWTELNIGLDDANQQSVSAIAISPHFAVDQTLFVASDTVGIYRSIDAGKHWTSAYDEGLAFDTLLFSPTYATDRTIYAGEDGRGVYRSTDGGATWKQMNHGFVNPDFGGPILTLAFAPGKPTNLFAGFWGGLDCGVWQYEFPSSQVFLALIRK
jgi:hypothetical protein